MSVEVVGDGDLVILPGRGNEAHAEGLAGVAEA